MHLYRDHNYSKIVKNGLQRVDIWYMVRNSRLEQLNNIELNRRIDLVEP